MSLPAIVSEAGTKVLGAETVTTAFDTASTPSWMSGGFGWGTYVAESRVAADGRVVALDLGNTYGAVVSYQYEDGTERLSNISLTRQSYGVGLSLDYGYDAAGNVTSIFDQASPAPAFQDNQCFGYDGLSRLEVAWSSAAGDCAVAQSALTTADVGGVSPYWTEYEYDTLGNRRHLVEHAVAGGSSTVPDYAHGGTGLGAHQLGELVETVGGVSTTTSFAYDDAGNRTSSTTDGDATAYDWDAEGELVGVDDAEYVYDASGSRIVRSDESGTTVYLPGGQEVLISPEGDVSAARYYSFAGQLVAVRESSGLGGVDSLVVDHQGSVVAAVPNTEWTPGSVSVVRTDPFGGVRGGSDEGVPGDKRFLGLTHDESSGLSLFGARYYDSVTGTFLSVDPVLDPDNPAQFNAYAYGWNNPVTHSDPTGLEPASEKQGLGKKNPPPGNGPPVVADRIEEVLDLIDAALNEIMDLCPSGNIAACVQNPTKDLQQLMHDWGWGYQGDGDYYSVPNSWQLGAGYAPWMDLVFELFTGFKAMADRITFEYGNRDYAIWWWKGWYWFLGPGGEVGTYVANPELEGHWDAAPIETTPLMSVTVRTLDGEWLGQYAPEEVQQWVASWSSTDWDKFLDGSQLLVEYSITFPNRDMYNAFVGSDDFKENSADYTFRRNPTTYTVTFGWRRRRR